MKNLGAIYKQTDILKQGWRLTAEWADTARFDNDATHEVMQVTDKGIIRIFNQLGQEVSSYRVFVG